MSSKKKSIDGFLERAKARSEPPQGIQDDGSDDIFGDLLAKAVKASPEAPQELLESQLPLWPASTRGVPNAILRSALFGVIQRGKRRYQEGVELASIGDIKIIYTGPRLDQGDLDVWEQCLSLARSEGLGEKIQFTANDFLRSIGRGVGRTQHVWLKKALTRLSGSVVEIEDGDRAYFGTLLNGGGRDESSGRYVIEINLKIKALYGHTAWTQIQWDERHRLNKHLAQWLHGFYSTHKQPFPIKVETIHKLCGSETKNLIRFKQALKAALKELSRVTGWSCGIDVSGKVKVIKQANGIAGIGL
jgi:hypothetical protein